MAGPSTLHILIVEDHPEQAQLLRENLAHNPSAVDIFWTPDLNEGLKRLAEGTIDLVLLGPAPHPDPNLDGLNRLTHQVPDVPVILMGEHEDDELALQAIQRGCQDVIVQRDCHSPAVWRRFRLAIGRHRFVQTLRQSNQKLLERQKDLIQEERLKVLLQLAGATAHELNQPLTILLGNIELMRLSEETPEKFKSQLDRVDEAGQRISNIIRRIQNLRHDQTKPYFKGSAIINLDQPTHILSVEDSTGDFRRIEYLLGKFRNVLMTHAINCADAVELLRHTRYDLILLDYFLPDGSGLDVLHRIQADGIETPVVVVTGHGDELIASQMIQAGAYDYLPKTSLNEESLKRVINNALEKSRLQQEVKMALQKMAEMSTRDELTGLYNRRYFQEALAQETARAERYDTGLVLCMMDLDHFKDVNDRYGHPAGDMVLGTIGQMLRRNLRQSDIACRYGGEEFAVILPNTRMEFAQLVSERFRKELADHVFAYEGRTFQLTVSIGLAVLDVSLTDAADRVVQHADAALYRAKQAGRNQVRKHPPPG